MIFILLLIAIIILLGAIMTSNAGRNSVNVLAVQENLKRVHPDDALSQLGPNEFEAGYMRAHRKRQGAINMAVMVGGGAGLVAGMLFGFALIEDDAAWATILIVGLPSAGILIGRNMTQNRTPEVLDLMRQELHL